MPVPPLSEAQSDIIIAAEKAISGRIDWVYNPYHNQDWAKFEVTVENDLGLNLRLYGNARLLQPAKSSFSLILNGAFRVFSLDVNGSHTNKHTNKNEWKNETHKQRWTDVCRNSDAFTPEEDIPEEPNAAFEEFCKECNIAFTGRISVLPNFQSSFQQ